MLQDFISHKRVKSEGLNERRSPSFAKVKFVSEAFQFAQTIDIDNQGTTQPCLMY